MFEKYMSIISSAVDLFRRGSVESSQKDEELEMDESSFATRDELEKHYATKADVSEKIDKFRDQLFSRLTWLVAVSIIAIGGWIHYSTSTLLKASDDKTEAQIRAVDTKIEALSTKLDINFVSLNSKLDSQSADIKVIKDSLAKISQKK